jgi:hypothetical protein
MFTLLIAMVPAEIATLKIVGRHGEELTATGSSAQIELDDFMRMNPDELGERLGAPSLSAIQSKIQKRLERHANG